MKSIKNIRQAFVPVFLLLFPVSKQALSQNSGGASLIGIWQGTSICQVKNSPCHDEIVVYHISRGITDSTFTIKANKIVNGQEEEMGDIHFVFDPRSSQLRSTDYRSIWTFKLDGNKMNGTLFYQNALYRIIKLSKKEG